jgi:hypothetical protein
MTSKGTVAAILEEKNGLTQASLASLTIFIEKRLKKIHNLLITYALCFF